MSEENVQPQGKGMAVGGFVLALVGFCFSWLIAGLAAASVIANAAMGQSGGKGLMYFWIVLCVLSVVLSAMGMMKLGKTGGKKGLAIAGLIIGIVATVWSVFLLMGLSVYETGMNTLVDSVDSDAFQDAMQDAMNE